MKFTTVIAAALSMATFAMAVPIAAPAPAKGTYPLSTTFLIESHN